MSKYSIWNIARHAATGHRNWDPAWRSPELKDSYDVVIIGGGGHGLATAYFLAREHGITNVAVLEKGYIGGGNTGRNTQVVRSNYFYPESSDFYDRSLQLYEGLTNDLDFNIMLSQRGILSLAHSRHELEGQRRWANAIQINGVDSEVLTADEIARMEPALNMESHYPVIGGFMQRRGGVVRHDAVAWGFARAASDLGVDIIQQCEVTGFDMDAGRIRGVHTTRGNIATERIGVAVAGHSTQIADMAGIHLPITSMSLQAMVTEPVKPVLNTIILSAAIHVYVSQSDRGEVVIGGGADVHNSFAQRGTVPPMEANIRATLELFPSLSRLKLLRQWAGIVDISPDTTPILGKTPVQGLYFNCGWGTGGFKAIPAGGETFAHTIAHDDPHPLVEAFSLERFYTGALVDEGAAAGVAH
ncbi:MAG: sarcosine oxidase subunit beta family protein [Pseudomonadales bacterium]|nr:sarcosine oxidase subunit beta family protein [Kiritimatiellia bacterium]MDP6973224.1 sarcosine oxidase subunit beta family protein [Pseudomonadales bacterium]